MHWAMSDLHSQHQTKTELADIYAWHIRYALYCPLESLSRLEQKIQQVPCGCVCLFGNALESNVPNHLLRLFIKFGGLKHPVFVRYEDNLLPHFPSIQQAFSFDPGHAKSHQQPHYEPIA